MAEILDGSQGSSRDANSIKVQERIEKFCIDEPVEYVTFHMISGANNDMAVPFVKTTYPLEWIRFYLLNNLMKVDPVVRFSRTAKTAFFWMDIPLSNVERQMMTHATEHGLSVDGYTVPTKDVGPYRGLFSLCPEISASAQDWRKYIELNGKRIETVAYALHGIARTIIDPYEDYAANLSPREIECLKYIAAGKTHSDIALILELSEHTVRSYCRALRLKLNCSTLAQAVAKACALGII